ncbi:diacylglycerol kinase family protein [Nocardia sp. CNY236]|uniref:diacylglycerol kinase family protein n=1 Tax=Nocardia sp. CNY236 TaxID=1169152 RepID=UPI0003F9D2ED|nr:diacylglycerol kinase family protein [Nocardia sp. CNY236]
MNGHPSDRAIVVVTNPMSGMGRGREVADAAIARFRAHDVQVIEVRANSAAESVRHVRDALAGAVPPESVVCVGGDGLIHATLPAVAQTSVPLGMIPAGTGNDLARELAVPTDDPAAAADIVLQGRTRTVDLGRIESAAPDGSPVWFVTVLGTGFDARVTVRANTMRWPKGRLRYVAAALVELSGRLTVPYQVELIGAVTDGLTSPGVGSRLETTAVMVAIGNSRTYGGGMLICQDAIMDDGLLDVTVVGALSRPQMLRLLPALSARKRQQHPAVQQFRAEAITLTAPGAPATADGEPVGSLPITVRAVPSALTLLVP